MPGARRKPGGRCVITNALNCITIIQREEILCGNILGYNIEIGMRTKDQKPPNQPKSLHGNLETISPIQSNLFSIYAKPRFTTER